MRRTLLAVAFATALGVIAPTAQGSTGKGHPESNRQRALRVSVFATGLNNPRGLTFGPNRNLFVAEGGLGGTDATTPAQCAQVPPPLGPYTGSTNDQARGGRISRVSPRGVVTPVVVGLPSSQTSQMTGSSISGVADVEFLRGSLYALLAGAGCSHGVPTVPNGVIRVASGGTWSPVANLSAFLAANPVAEPDAEDFEPDGTWYDMVAARGALYAVEPNHGEVDRIGTDGTVRRIVDVSATEGHAVPTAITFHGVFYLGNLGVSEPGRPVGDERIWALTPNGRLRVRASRLEKVLGVVWRRGALYALQMSRTAAEPAPATGSIVRIRRGRPAGVIASGLTFPTAMTVGPDGAFYVSERGFGFGAGEGRILRIGR